MLTNRDIEECLVMAEVSVAENIESALLEFYRPDVEREAAMLYADMSEPLKKRLKAKAPEAVRRIERQIEGR